MRFQENGWQEPYESRGSRTVLRGTGGETPPVYPTLFVVFFFILDVFCRCKKFQLLNMALKTFDKLEIVRHERTFI